LPISVLNAAGVHAPIDAAIADVDTIVDRIRNLFTKILSSL